jgi:hypothetical protein
MIQNGDLSLRAMQWEVVFMDGSRLMEVGGIGVAEMGGAGNKLVERPVGCPPCTGCIQLKRW